MSTNQKLLIVEDDESARSVIRDALDVIANLDFLEASNGIEALRVVNESEPDVILLDLLMPELDGSEVLKRLRLDSRRGRIKVLVISALSEPALIELLSELGADGVVPKPFHVDELTSMVQQAVDDVRAQHRPAATPVVRAPEAARRANRLGQGIGRGTSNAEYRSRPGQLGSTKG